MHTVSSLNLTSLIRWFTVEKREFPWREHRTPYRVWISEVMLQQTQASRVINFFENWMIQFPDVQALAQAKEAEVLKAWEGLGYYSRARALHATAQHFVNEHQGEIPNDARLLSQMKGFGPYTTGALLSFGFHLRQIACDANVLRVICRLFAIDEPINKPKVQKKLWELAEELIPQEESWVVNEALIELGALICSAKKPKCGRCPLKFQCASYKRGIQESLPQKSSQTVYTALYREVAVIHSEGMFLIKQGSPGVVMAGLYEFPYFESSSEGWEGDMLREKILQELSLDVCLKKSLPPIKHSYTRFRVTLYPKIFELPQRREIAGYSWRSIESCQTLAFSSGHKRLLTALHDIYNFRYL